MKLLHHILLLFSLIYMSNVASEEQEKTPIFSQKINEYFYLLSSPSISHIGLVVGENGLMLIDSGLVNESRALLEAIRGISLKPIKYVLNTHHHPDHSGGNLFFAKLGATIITQENTRYTSAYGQVRFKDSLTLDLGVEQVLLFHMISHTYNDTIIYLKNSNALFMGDNLSTHAFLSVGEKGLEGHLALFDSALSLADRDTLVIPAHAGVAGDGSTLVNKQTLHSYKQKSTDWIKRLGELNRQGLNQIEIKKDNRLKQLTRKFAVDNRRNKATDYFGLHWSVGKAIELEFYQRTTLTEQQLAGYVGNYRLNDDVTVEILNENGRLYAREVGGYLVELIYKSENRFDMKGYFFEENKEEIQFNQSESGDIRSLNIIIDDSSRWSNNGWNFLNQIKTGIREKF